MKTRDFTAEELARFKFFQRRSYKTLEQVAATLVDGDTEIAVTRRMRKAFHEQGVHHYFHVPVALFGERTAYPGDFGQLGALPTEQRLAPGMAVILDAAPVYEGYTVDTSLATSYGDNAAVPRLLRELKPLRELILARVRERRTFRAIAREVDAAIRERGYENCHRKHIAAVLAHRVTLVPDRWIYRRRLWGLGWRQAGYFIGKSLAAEWFGGEGSPNWNHTRSSDHPPTPGLWAVEPHLARDGVGAKFEEILVITRDDAFWLDEDGLPHHAAWRAGFPDHRST